MTSQAQTDLALPRAQWAAHPRYPQQALLMRSHDAFRHTSRRLIADAEAGVDPRAVGSRFRWWKSAMHSHEAYEEQKLYPYLEARWGISCAPLRAGHAELDEAEQAVYAAIEGHAASGHDADDRALVVALRHHDQVLDAHLDAEEDVVIPALLALSPGEFHTYYHGAIGSLLAQMQRDA